MMISIRKGSKTTFSLMLFIAVIVVLTYFINQSQSSFFYRIRLMLESSYMLGGYHRFVLSMCFWTLLISSVLKVIFLRKTGFYVIGSFGVPLIFSACAFVCCLIVSSTGLDMRWFWLVYYIGLIICLRIDFGKMSDIKGAGSRNYKPFFKDLYKSSNYGDSQADIIILQTSKIALIIVLVLSIVSLVVYCVQYRNLLPFFK